MDPRTFEAAVCVGKRASPFKGIPSKSASRESERSFVICSEDGRVLSRVAKADVLAEMERQEQYKQNREVRSEAAVKAEAEKNIRLRGGTNERRAIAWAKSVGYVVPRPGDFFTLETLLASIVLGFLCLLPGIIYIILALQSDNRAKGITADLVSRWIDAGRPDPAP